MKRLHSILTLVAFLIAATSLHAQSILVDKTQLSFTAMAGTTPAATQTINATSSTSGIFFIATATVQGTSTQWLKLSNSTSTTPQIAITGVTPNVITVTADPTGLSAGTYTGSIGFGNVSVAVTFTVASIGVYPTTANLGSYQAGSTTYPSAVTLSVSGAGTSGFTISKGTADTWYTAAIFGSPASAIVIQFNQAAASTLTAGTTYTGTLTVTPTGTSNNVPVAVPVSLTVTASPTVTVAPASLAFNWQASGTNNQSQQTLQFTTTASIPVSYAITGAGASWISIPTTNPTSLQPSGTSVSVGVNGSGLSAGTYTSSITVTVSGALFSNGTSSLTIPMSLMVSNFALLNVTPAALTFSYQFGSGSANYPSAQNITPSSTGAPNTQVQYTVSASPSGTWLTVPAGLLTSGTAFAVSVSPGSLAPKTYTGSVILTPVANGSGQGTITIPITLTVTNTPTLVVSSYALAFPYQLGQVAPSAQIVSVTSSNGSPLNYTVTQPSSTTSWLVLGGTTSGTTDQTSFTVTVNTANAVAGTQDGTLTLTATDPVTGAAVGSALTIDVKFYVSATPLLVVSPQGPITLSALQNSSSQPVTISFSSTSASTPVTISSVSFNGSWISSTAAPTTTPGAISISAIAGSTLTPGAYSGSVVVNATSGGTAVADSPFTIPVTFQLNATTGAVSPASLSFTAQTGGTAAAAQTLTITTNGVALPYSAVANDGGINWLSVTNATGTTSGTVSVSVDASKLTTGTYYGAVYVNIPTAGGAPFRIPVTFTVTAGTIAATPASLSFTQVAGGTAPASQAIAVTATGSALNFTVGTNMTSGSGWLSAVVGSGTAVSGTTPATVNVTANGSSLAAGTYTGNVTIAAPGATGSPITIPVTLTVTAPQTLTFSSTSAISFAYTIGVTASPMTQTVGLTSTGMTTFAATATTKDNGGWLSVSPTSGTASTTATTLTISAKPSGLAAGSYTGTISVTSANTLTPITLTVNLTVAALPTPVLTAIQNSASYTTGAVAPGELVLIYGTNVGPSTLTYGAVSNSKLATTVAGTQVLFDTTAAPIYYATATQTAVFVPYEVAGRATTQVTVITQGVVSSALTYTVVAAQPGIYTQNQGGNGPGSILNQDYSVNGPANGAAAGSIIQVYMTGEGQTNPAGVTGAVVPLDGTGLKKPVQTVTATIGGIALTGNAIAYAGSAPGDVNGVFQVNLVVPSGLATGAQPIVVTVGSVSSQSGVTVQLK